MLQLYYLILILFLMCFQDKCKNTWLPHNMDFLISHRILLWKKDMFISHIGHWRESVSLCILTPANPGRPRLCSALTRSQLATWARSSQTPSFSITWLGLPSESLQAAQTQLTFTKDNAAVLLMTCQISWNKHRRAINLTHSSEGQTTSKSTTFLFWGANTCFRYLTLYVQAICNC